ncbi:ribosome-recycling factor, mitochondrial-like [Argonauta hians]
MCAWALNPWRMLPRVPPGLFIKAQQLQLTIVQKCPTTGTLLSNQRHMLHYNHHAFPRRYRTLQPSAASVDSPFNWYQVREYAKASKSKKKTASKPKVYLSDEQIEEVIDLTALKSEMCSVLEQLKLDYLNQISLRVSTRVFDSVAVKIDNKEFPLNQIAQIVQKNPSLIIINLRESGQYLPAVKNAIIKSGVAPNPQVEGTSIFIPIPKVSKEHREKLCKSAKVFCEKSKQKLREISNKYSKKLRNNRDNHSQDIVKNIQDMVLHVMQEKMSEAEDMMTRKQKDLMGEQR